MNIGTSIDLSELSLLANEQSLRLYRANVLADFDEQILGSRPPDRSENDLTQFYLRAVKLFSHCLFQDSAVDFVSKKSALITSVGDAVALVQHCGQALLELDRIEKLYTSRLRRLQEFQKSYPEHSESIFEMVAQYQQSLYSVHLIDHYDFDHEWDLQEKISTSASEWIAAGVTQQHALAAWNQALLRVSSFASKSFTRPLRQADHLQLPNQQALSIDDAATIQSLEKYALVFAKNMNVLENQLAEQAMMDINDFSVPSSPEDGLSEISSSETLGNSSKQRVSEKAKKSFRG